MLASCKTYVLAIGLVLTSSGIGMAQSQATAPEDSFNLENAILDTSILFTIGAREARQDLRGAFGWPTFQEGLVQGVYFRFDPDGYARFSPTPRLDTDVFEVICRPRTHICMGRKEVMSVTLNSRGQIELKFENISEGDVFSVVEGISELPLPESILRPLDTRMEVLLSTEGDLVVRRAQQEVERVSLKGFAAVISYLRWVNARQDYAVLPHSWPVPNAVSTTTTPGLTQASSWQVVAPQTQPLQPIETPSPSQSSDLEVAELRQELQTLRQLLAAQQTSTVTEEMASLSAQTQPVQPESDPRTEQRLFELQRALDMLSQDFARYQSGQAEPQLAASPQATASQLIAPQPETMTQGTTDAMSADLDPSILASRLEYLMTEIGLAPKVALMLIQQEPQTEAIAETQAQTDVVEDILNELRGQIAEPAMAQESEPQQTIPQNVSEQEYQLLTDYFRSVFATN